MGIGIKDNTGDTNGATVNANHELSVVTAYDIDDVGQIAIGAESNPANVGIGRRVRPAEISADYRLRTAIDSMVFSDNFSHAQKNASKYKMTDTTMTNALSGGRWVLNSGNSLTAAQGTQIQTYSKFGLSLSASLFFDVVGLLAVEAQVNNVIEFGIFQCSGVTAPTDGILFRLNASGVWQGVVNIGGSETPVSLVSAPGVPLVLDAVKNYHFCIVMHNDITDFWVDDILVGVQRTPTGFGAPFLTMSGPATIREYNLGTVTTAQRFEMANMSVTQGDVNNNRLWSTVMAGMGNSSVNIPDGTAAGQTANYTIAAAPVLGTAATMITTAATYSTLGGGFQLTALAGAETDIIVFDYLNPAATAAIPGKNLIIRGVKIDTVNLGAVVSTSPTVLQWALGVGATAVTTATADSLTAGTRAARKVTLGMQSFVVGAVVGAQAPTVDVNMDAPMITEPGTHVQIFLRIISGIATASQILRGTCFINGYFE